MTDKMMTINEYLKTNIVELSKELLAQHELLEQNNPHLTTLRNMLRDANIPVAADDRFIFKEALRFAANSEK